MLDTRQIDDFLASIGILDMSYSESMRDSFGDLVSVFDPEMNYREIRRAVDNSRPMRNKIVDCGLNFVEIHDDVYIEGNRVKIAILCEVGENGYGTSIKVMVKRINVFLDGEMRVFLGYESLKSYLNRMSAST